MPSHFMEDIKSSSVAAIFTCLYEPVSTRHDLAVDTRVLNPAASNGKYYDSENLLQFKFFDRLCCTFLLLVSSAPHEMLHSQM